LDRQKGRVKSWIGKRGGLNLDRQKGRVESWIGKRGTVKGLID
jgi:hypothetical protein